MRKQKAELLTAGAEFLLTLQRWVIEEHIRVQVRNCVQRSRHSITPLFIHVFIRVCVCVCKPYIYYTLNGREVWLQPTHKLPKVIVVQVFR